AADDQQPRVEVREAPEGAHQHFEALETLNAAYEQHDFLVWRQAQLCPGLRLRPWAEPIQVDATGDHVDRRVRLVVPNNLLPVDRGQGDHAVRAGHGPPLDLVAHRLLAFGRRFGDSVLELGQRVEGAHQRYAPVVGEQQAQTARQPVMAVDEVIADARQGAETLDAACEVGQVVE